MRTEQRAGDVEPSDLGRSEQLPAAAAESTMTVWPVRSGPGRSTECDVDLIGTAAAPCRIIFASPATLADEMLSLHLPSAMQQQQQHAASGIITVS